LGWVEEDNPRGARCASIGRIVAPRSYKDYGMSTGEYEAFVLPAYPMKDRSGSGVAERRAFAPSPFPSDKSRSGVTPIGGTEVADAPDSMMAVTSADELEMSGASVVKQRPNMLRVALFMLSGGAVGILAAMVARQYIGESPSPSAKRAAQALEINARESSATPPAVARVETARVVRAPETMPPRIAPGLVPPVAQGQAGAMLMLPPGAAPPQHPMATPSQPMQVIQTPRGQMLVPVPARNVAVAGGLALKAPAPPKRAPAPRHVRGRSAPRASAAEAPVAAAPRPVAPSVDVVQKGRTLADEAL
jgi:hypothetical protein